MKHQHEDRALVNGVPCVRVSIRNFKPCQMWPDPCEFCPLQARHETTNKRLCDSSCGGAFIWVTVADWIAIKLEAA